MYSWQWWLPAFTLKLVSGANQPNSNNYIGKGHKLQGTKNATLTSHSLYKNWFNNLINQ